ncbi:M36 family metallopeptidase [Emticicia sp. BO119]|uniref:M36 family metallopeptidase n=1 Tax=Emticicia sp. BO119 TaxID=2757768 RepID=UPI0015F01F02|nr:M36 family metallopeptidase [Emticicia sp. BO119]MBA4849354.1 M36 family metallopeptidase [Emticicia sp. BO119]
MSKLLHFRSQTLRRLYLLLGTLVVSLGGYAQKEVEKVKTYLKSNTSKYQLSNSDIDEMGISSDHLSPTTGWYHIYFVQKYQSIEVYNGILNTVLVNDNVANVTSNFVTSIASKVPVVTIIPVTPLNAISRAASSLKLSDNSANTQEVSANRLPNGQIESAIYTNADLSKENIPVKLYWFPYDTLIGQERVSKVSLVWNVQIYTKDYKNNWSVQVDALTGDIIDTKDLVVHCDFGVPGHTHESGLTHGHTNPAINDINLLQPLAANSYRVFDYPLESPNHGARTLVASPYTKFVSSGTGPGVTNGWHNDSTANYTNTRGNNVWAKDDLANDNEGTIGSSPSSATLEFDYPYTQATGTAAANLNAAITNLFYWNNVIHDILYKYGFDEPSGNFQEANLGRGGGGSDFVYADAQDGSGTNNANFGTPIDGQNPRMQMYRFSDAGNPAYTPDSDFDNGVITHEYGHGWSNRLTSGRNNVTCLQNAEQAGEGWSDYLALMLTTNWSTLTPTLASANLPRGMGSYVLGQTTDGRGIRPYPYSYDMATINGLVTYGRVGDSGNFSLPHGIGSIWATMLWDMTWEIIMQDNQIVSNIYNTSSLVGNVAALKLVNEGLKLQPCSPSFVEARDAILKADSILFNKKYKCSIWKAFARRGLGRLASTGSLKTDRVVTEDFTPFFDRPLTSSKVATVCSNTPFSYTATTSVGGTTFSWSRSAVTGISNAASNGNSATINETLINTTSSPITVTYQFFLTPSNCAAIPQSVQVRVDPTPTPTVATYNICKDASVPGGQGLAVTNITDSNTLTGTLTYTSPIYRRGNGNNVLTYTPIASNNQGSAVYFKAHTFVAAVSGSVSIQTGAATALQSADRYDTYITLYQTSFDPNSPSTNFLIGDDDSGPFQYSSKITYNFTAGNTYVLVVTTWGNRVIGDYTMEATATLFKHIGWYANSSGGAALATSNIFNPVGVAGSGVPNTATPGTTNFYVSTSDLGTCRAKTSFIINPSSVGGNIAGSTNVCTPTNSGTLTLSGHTGSILRWESSTDNFVSNIVSITNTTTTLNFSNLAQTTKYRAVVKSGSCAQVYSAIATITVVTASPPTPTGNSRCGTGTVLLTATGCAGGTINWYAGVSGGSVLASGTSFTTPSISITTTYYVSCTVSGCTSNRVAVTATIKSIPGAPTTTSVSRCGPGTVTLTATGCGGGTINWYTGSTGGTPVGTGGTFTTPSLATTTPYYASCTVDGCTSVRTVATATINVNLTFTGNQAAGNYRASNSITSTANVATGVNYYAAKYIELNAGFQAGGSEVFLAKIENCP